MERLGRFSALVILFGMLFLAQALAHGVCGYVNDADDLTAAAWRHVILYYPSDKAHFIPCEINPERNAYCCDAEGIPNHAWKKGDTVVVEVADEGDGYVALPILVNTTAEGHDVAPLLQLAPL